MIIPIFKNLQRSMAGMPAASRLRHALGITAQGQLFNKDGTLNETTHLPDGYNLSNKQNNDINLENPSSWPINSEEARSIRKQFIADGFRRLYAQRVTNNAWFVQNDGLQEEDMCESNLAFAVRQLGSRLFDAQMGGVDGSQVVFEGSSSGEQNDDFLPSLTVTEEDDWMYLPQ